MEEYGEAEQQQLEKYVSETKKLKKLHLQIMQDFEQQFNEQKKNAQKIHDENAKLIVIKR